MKEEILEILKLRTSRIQDLNKVGFEGPVESLTRQLLDAVRLEEIQILQNYIHKIESREKTQMDLGEFMCELGSFDDSIPLRTNRGAGISGFGSYRGDYSQMAINYTNDPNLWMSVGKLRSSLQFSKGEWLVGYKGGECQITESTLINLANYGEYSGLRVVGLKLIQGECVIFTKGQEF